MKINKMVGFLVLAFLIAAVSAGRLPEQHMIEFPTVSYLSGRIINGTETTIEENPHQVSLNHPAYGQICGGSIISRKWVLTAGHCLPPKLVNETVVFAGMTNQLIVGTRHRISKVIVHEDFHVKRYGVLLNDIALVEVVDLFEFDEKHARISLFGTNEQVTVGSIGIVTGWGETGHGRANILRLVEIPIISKAKCSELYSYVGGLPERQICAAHAEGQKDGCSGDSGGPLVVNQRLAGIVSWGDGCGIAGKPGVYTEIAAYRDWIKINSGV